eukprot:CAMPEP_0197940366 /NCGR_PEP_ID=MMETSP1439-20131203/121123_1 /TAXON_ID=66791 /ORGANISM="Gonyaulax spinifera, Strain CCMP409" /LENGTH=405 /DNA_ID=CAMNT_0043563525 /DNA_START=29 /DNA_END=1243 /DNA_ORIENTATION=+
MAKPSDSAGGSSEHGSESEVSVAVKKANLAKAIKAVKLAVTNHSANANPLFDSSSETMTLVFSLARVPEKKKTLNAALIPLPHPLYNDKSEVCFISKDPQKTFKELLMQKHPTPGLTKVISLGKLRQKYHTLQAKRDLANSFDLFLCDKQINEMLPGTLGNSFYTKNQKFPIPVKLALTDPRPGLEKAIRSTPLRVPKGPSVGVKFGRVSMSEEQLLENAAAVIACAVKRIEIPVQSVSVQATDAPCLPVWRRPRPAGELLDLAKHRRADDSSAASDTGASGVSETEGSMETLSVRETASEVGTAAETLSELDTAGETHSELDSEAGDVDDERPLPKQELPLVRGLKGSKKRRGKPVDAEPAPPAAGSGNMGPPATKKAKRSKAARDSSSSAETSYAAEPSCHLA